MSGQSKLLEIEGLTVRIPLRGGDIVHAASGIDLTVHRGEVVAVVGESGCGKSIIASTVVGSLPPHAVTSGYVRYFYPDGKSVDIGKDITGAHVWGWQSGIFGTNNIKKHLGIISQILP